MDLYRARCNELALQLENVTAALELSRANYNNLEHEMGDTIECLEAENREKDCKYRLRLSTILD